MGVHPRLLPTLSATLIVGGALGVVGCGAPASESTPPEFETLLDELQAMGQVRVAVVLDVPEMQDPGERQQRIAAAQDEVLAALDPDQYRDVARLQTVPAMALTLLAEEALSTLRAHPLVVKVDPDVGGVG
jgi:hypothetical protein